MTYIRKLVTNTFEFILLGGGFALGFWGVLAIMSALHGL